MRIAQVTISHGPMDVRVFWKEARSLAAAGHEVHVLAPGPAQPDSDGVRFHSLPEDIGASTAYFWRVWRRLPGIYRIARSVRADAYQLPDPALIPMALLLKLRGATIVYDAHEDRPLQALTKYRAIGRPVVAAVSSVVWWALEWIGRRFFDRFVAATPAIGEKYPRRRTVTVCNFPLEEEFAELERPPYGERPNRVVFVGALHRFKGIEAAVRGMSLLPAHLDARLLLVGGFARAGGDYQRRIESLPGWDRVDLVGQLPRPEALAMVAGSRIGLVTLDPSCREHRVALGNKMFEYMAAGIPQVASDFPLWRQIVRDGGLGLTVDPADPDAIAEAFQWLLEHPDEAEAMGNRARGAVASSYNWRTEASKLIDLYAELGGFEPDEVERRYPDPARARSSVG